MTGDMSSRVARLATFERPAQLSKKRASAQSKKKLQSISWPHKTPTADSLARAGFFFYPDGSDGDDNVKCFSCRANLNGWEPHDDPLKEHIAHRPDCNWAIALSVARKEDEEPETRDPISKELVQARINTFGADWPHDKEEGSKCSIINMAEAGWVFDGGEGYEDGTTCHYCDLMLDGWEPDDDPVKEHQKREPNCRFFALMEQYHGSKSQKKSKAKTAKRTKSNASKASRASVQSTISTAPSEAPSIDDTMADELTVEDLKESVKAETKNKKRAMNSKTSKARQTDAEDKTAASDIAESDAEAIKQPKKATKKSSKASKKQSTATDSDTQQTQQSSQPTAKSKKAKPSTAPVAADEHSKDASTQLQYELDDSIVLEDSPRGSKRSSDGSIKIDSSSMLADFPEPPKDNKKSMNKTKSKKAASSSAQEIEVEQEESQPPHKKIKSTKAASSRSSAKAKPDLHSAEYGSMSQSDEEAIEVELARIEAEQRQRDVGTATKHNAIGLSQDDFEILKDEVDSEMPDEPLLRKYAMTGSTIRNTPLTSPVSSNKENNASSLLEESAKDTKPAYTSPTKTTRIPLAPSTPNRTSPAKRIGTVSPSRKLLGMTRTTAPWSAIDLENVLVMCTESTPGKLRDQLITAAGALTEAERSMSVETWIKAKALQADEELKRRCEEMVGVFEREGNRALASLQGMTIAT